MKTTYLLAALCGALLTACSPTVHRYATNELQGHDPATLAAVQEKVNRKGTEHVALNPSVPTIQYDENGPLDLHMPHLLQPAKDYDSSQMSTFSVWDEPHWVYDPAAEYQRDKVALWCTKEKTYLATVYQLRWNRHYFQMKDNCYIRDCATDKRYYIVGSVLGYPMNETFFIDGIPGAWICFVYEFPPLPATCTSIDIIEPGTTDVVENAPGWGGNLNIKDVAVSKLQRQQFIIQYHKPTVIE